MKRISCAAVLISSILFQQCKRECVGLSEGTILLKPNEVSSLAYHGNDSVVFLENGVQRLFVSSEQTQYFNTYNPNTNCSASLKLEGSQTLLKDTSASAEIYHNQSVYSTDTSSSFITITYKGRNFGFPYSNLNRPSSSFPLNINGKSYSNVYRDKSANDSIYYNKANGIIRIRLESGHILQLQ